MTMAAQKHPSNSEIEISIFGPGYGESIVAHLGNGNWVIIDSCINTSSKEPAALAYFRNLGVDLQTQVKFIVATHWHDDHIRGLASIVDKCPRAKVVISDALRNEEVVAMISAFGKRAAGKNTSGVTELYNAFRVLSERKHKPIWAKANCVLLRLRIQDKDVTMHALSPSDSSLTQAKLALSKLLPLEMRPKQRVGELTPNDASVAIWLELGDLKILLGADLEESENPEAGWSAIVTSETRPPGQASMYKIAHHGSDTGHHDDIWKKLLDSDALSVVTPFNHGSVFLPGPKEIRRICSYTQKAYSTSMPRFRKTQKSQAVLKTVSKNVRWIGQINPKTGHVRLRMPFSADRGTSWSVELLDGAITLSEKLAIELQEIRR